MHCVLYLPKASAQLLPPYLNPDIFGVWFTTILPKIIDWPQPGSDFEVQRSPARLARCVNWWSRLLEQLGSKTSRYWTLKVERGFHRICLEGFPWVSMGSSFENPQNPNPSRTCERCMDPAPLWCWAISGSGMCCDSWSFLFDPTKLGVTLW